MQFADLPFIQNKIAALGTALFLCQQQNILPFSTYLVEAMPCNEDRFISFCITNQSNHPLLEDASFPATLHFYRKGVSFIVSVKGMVSVEKYDQYCNTTHPAGKLLLKIKIEEAKYTTLHPALWQKFAGRIYRKFRNGFYFRQLWRNYRGSQSGYSSSW